MKSKGRKKKPRPYLGKACIYEKMCIISVREKILFDGKKLRIMPINLLNITCTSIGVR